MFFFNDLSNPFSDMSIPGIFLAKSEIDSFGVDTELNCRFKRLALIFVSEWSLFLCFRGGMPCWSQRDFLKNENFLLSYFIFFVIEA